MCTCIPGMSVIRFFRHICAVLCFSSRCETTQQEGAVASRQHDAETRGQKAQAYADQRPPGGVRVDRCVRVTLTYFSTSYDRSTAVYMWTNHHWANCHRACVQYGWTNRSTKKYTNGAAGRRLLSCWRSCRRPRWPSSPIPPSAHPRYATLWTASSSLLSVATL